MHLPVGCLVKYIITSSSSFFNTYQYSNYWRDRQLFFITFKVFAGTGSVHLPVGCLVKYIITSSSSFFNTYQYSNYVFMKLHKRLPLFQFNTITLCKLFKSDTFIFFWVRIVQIILIQFFTE